MSKPLLFVGLLGLAVAILNAALYVATGEGIALLAAISNSVVMVAAFATSRYVGV